MGIVKRVHQDEYYNYNREDILDYSDMFPTINHLFTGYYTNNFYNK
jgi:hypothetical protein